MLRLCSPHALPHSLIEMGSYAQNCQEFPALPKAVILHAVGDTRFVSFGPYSLPARNELLRA